jgi:hypothetical protein
MDADRFDTLARVLTTSSRRGISRGLAGIALGGLFASVRGNASEAKKGKKGKKGKKKAKPCPPCRLKKDGKCNAKQPDGTECGPCQSCLSGACIVTKPDDSPCNGNGKCLVGVCNPLPDCKSPGSGCTAATEGECCSGECSGLMCYWSTASTGICKTSDDCFQDIGFNHVCVAYRCRRS